MKTNILSVAGLEIGLEKIKLIYYKKAEKDYNQLKILMVIPAGVEPALLA